MRSVDQLEGTLVKVQYQIGKEIWISVVDEPRFPPPDNFTDEMDKIHAEWDFLRACSCA